MRRVAMGIVAALIALATPAYAITVPSTTQVVAGARIAFVADPVAHGLVSGADRALVPAFAIADQTIPAGTVTIARGGTPLVTPTYLSIPIEIDVNGTRARTVVAGYRITTYIRTAVASHDLPAGTVLGDDDITVGRVPAIGRTAVAAADLVGRKLLSPVAHDAPVFPEQTATNQIVRAGDSVVLVVRAGVVALNADVVARTSGGMGDHVAVFNPQTQKMLSGIVTGPQCVELDLPGENE